MRSAVVLMFGLILLTAGATGTAGLTESDYRCLKVEFGLAKSSFTLKNIGAGEQTKLHELINEPTRKTVQRRATSMSPTTCST